MMAIALRFASGFLRIICLTLLNEINLVLYLWWIGKAVKILFDLPLTVDWSCEK